MVRRKPLLVLLLGACQPSPTAPPELARDPAALVDAPVETPTTPTPVTPSVDARSCDALAGPRHLVVVTWPSTLRRQLAQADTAAGLLVFARTDCEFELLPDCRVPGHYGRARMLSTLIPLPFADLDELWANLPELAAREPQEWSGPYLLEVKAAWTLRAVAWDPSEATLKGNCEGATHVLDTVELGAGRFSRGAYVEPYGPTEIDEVLVEFGNPSRCGDERHEDCEQAWAVTLVALADDGERDGCPGPTGYDGLVCSSPERTNLCHLVLEDRRCNQMRGDESRLRELLGPTWR
jgi:hypothetical protein